MRPIGAILFVVCLLLAATLAGCGNQLTAEEIVARMQETVENTDDAHAVVTTNIDAQGIQISLTAEVWGKGTKSAPRPGARRLRGPFCRQLDG